MKSSPIAIAAFIAAFAFSGCGADVEALESRSTKQADSTTEESRFLELHPADDGFVAVPKNRISGKALFVSVPKEGAPTVHLLAILGSDNKPRISFNTCQACNPSPRAYFEQMPSGNLRCANCGNQFTPDAVGATSGGCNPAFIPGVKETDDSLLIPAETLDSVRPRFKNWSGPTGH